MNARARRDPSKKDSRPPKKDSRTFECGNEAMLDGFHTGTLPKKLHAEIESHLTTCSACREIMADFELGVSIAGLLREARDEVPESLRRRLIESTTAFSQKKNTGQGREREKTEGGESS